MEKIQIKFFRNNFDTEFLKSGLSNDDFAKKAGITAAFCSQIRHGRRTGQRDIFKICKNLNKSVSVMIGEETEAPGALKDMAQNVEWFKKQLKKAESENKKLAATVVKLEKKLSKFIKKKPAEVIKLKRRK